MFQKPESHKIKFNLMSYNHNMPDQQRFIEHSCTAGLTNDLVQKFSNVFFRGAVAARLCFNDISGKHKQTTTDISKTSLNMCEIRWSDGGDPALPSCFEMYFKLSIILCFYFVAPLGQDHILYLVCDSPNA